MEYIGVISPGEGKSKVTMPQGIPKSTGGVYQILALGAPKEHYVGQSNNLFRRFYTDYKISSFHSDPNKRKTNQRVVAWIYMQLPKTKIEVYICTNAKLISNEKFQFDLDFDNQKHHRLLVENSVISCRPDLKMMNK